MNDGKIVYLDSKMYLYITCMSVSSVNPGKVPFICCTMCVRTKILEMRTNRTGKETLFNPFDGVEDRCMY